MGKARALIIIFSLFFAAQFTLLPAHAAHAELTVKDFIIVKDTSYFNYYINGIYQGLRLANSSLNATNRKQFFCIPDTLILDTHHLSSLVEDTVNAYQLAPDAQIEPIMLMALQQTFPCNN